MTERGTFLKNMDKLPLTRFTPEKLEKLRVKSLRSYNILDTLSESEYDSITKIAAGICNVPVSLMTLLDEKRQWFKSSFGFEITEIPRDNAFCNYLLKDPNQVLMVPDLRVDERFSTNPLVTGAPNVVFYAAAPLINEQGHVLGSICVYDWKQQTLNENQIAALSALAKQVMNSLELRRKVKMLKQTQKKLKQVNLNLKKYAHVISHDIKTPLACISLLTGSVRDCIDSDNEHTLKLLSLIDQNAVELRKFIDSVLIESNRTERTTGAISNPKTVIEQMSTLLARYENVSIQVRGNLPLLQITKTALKQVLQNLIINAIKYNDKEKVTIEISGNTLKGVTYIHVADNGIGIAAEKLDVIFLEHQTLGHTDRFGNKGTGIGLSTVKRVLSAIGGDITVSSIPAKGSVFTINIPFNDKRIVKHFRQLRIA